MNAPPRSANQRLKDAYGRMLAASLGRAALMHVLAFQFVVIPVPDNTEDGFVCLLPPPPAAQSFEPVPQRSPDVDARVPSPTELHVRRES